MISLFELVDEMPVLSTEARLIKEFNFLLSRDTSENKSVSSNELAFVYYTCDVLSFIVSEYPEEEQYKEAKKLLGFPPEWIPDEKIEIARIKYKEIQETASIVLLNSLRSTLYTANGVVKVLEKTIKDFIETVSSDNTFIGEDTDPASILKREEATQLRLNNAVKNLNTLISTAEKIPRTIAVVSEMEEKVKKERENEEVKKKKNPVSDFEDPTFLGIG